MQVLPERATVPALAGTSCRLEIVSLDAGRELLCEVLTFQCELAERKCPVRSTACRKFAYTLLRDGRSDLRISAGDRSFVAPAQRNPSTVRPRGALQGNSGPPRPVGCMGGFGSDRPSQASPLALRVIARHSGLFG